MWEGLPKRQDQDDPAAGSKRGDISKICILRRRGAKKLDSDVDPVTGSASTT